MYRHCIATMTRSLLPVCAVFVIFVFVTKVVGDEAMSVEDKSTDTDEARAKRQTFQDYGGVDYGRKGGCGGRKSGSGSGGDVDTMTGGASGVNFADRITNSKQRGNLKNSTNNRGGLNGRGGPQRRRGSVSAPEFQVPLVPSAETDSPPKPVPNNEGGTNKNLKNLASQLLASDNSHENDQ